MINKLILTHGSLARELLEAAGNINGEMDGFSALCLGWDDSLDVAREKTHDALRAFDNGSETLILTDMFGGTPYNVALGFVEPGHVELVTGVNLPMVLRLACQVNDEKSLGELGRWIRDKGRQSICQARIRQPSEAEPGGDSPAACKDQSRCGDS